MIALTVLLIFPAGSAYASWPEVDKLLASDGAEFDLFGYSVSISGDYAIVGALDDDNGSDSGSAYIFFYDGTSWSEQAKLTAADGNDDDRFGCSVSISGDYAVIGLSPSIGAFGYLVAARLMPSAIRIPPPTLFASLLVPGEPRSIAVIRSARSTQSRSALENIRLTKVPSSSS